MSNKNSDRARAWASAGYAVFPTRDKKPLTMNGVYDATTDLDTIAAWWEAEPQAIPAVRCKGFSVIDVDPPTGDETLLALASQNGLPFTWSQPTPRGGRHEFYRAAWPNTVGKLGVNLDTRGEGGYVLCYTNPPGPADLATAPAWIAARLAIRVERPSAPDTEIQPDGDANRMGGASYLVRVFSRPEFTVRHGERDAFTYKIAAHLREAFALSAGIIHELIEVWGHKYDGWGQDYFSDDLLAPIEHAFEYAQNPFGSRTVEATFEHVDTALFGDKQESNHSPAERWKFLTPDEQDAMEPPSMLIPDVVEDRCATMIFGNKNATKTLMTIALQCAAVSGKPSPFGPTPLRQGPCVLVSYRGEGWHGLPLRRQAWQEQQQVTNKELEDFRIVQGPRLARGEGPDFIAALETKWGKNLSILALDTALQLGSGLNFSDTGEKGFGFHLNTFVEAALERLNCAILVLHHPTKESKKPEDMVELGSREITANLAGQALMFADEGGVIHYRSLLMKDAARPPNDFTFRLERLGPSVVLKPVSLKEAAATAKEEELVAGPYIFAALNMAKIYGDKWINSASLADGLAPAVENRTELLKTIEAKLNRRAKTSLRAYCSVVDGSVRWSLPTLS